MNISDCKPGQPVKLVGMTGASAKLNDSEGYLNSPTLEETGLYRVRFLLKPATNMRDAETRDLLVGASKIEVLADKKPPRNFHWFFRAKSRRYAIQPSGEQGPVRS